MSKIQWCDETWNPIVGCSKISPGCKNCYAGEAAQQPRLQQFPQYRQVKDWDGTVEFVESQLLKPLTWRSPKKIFVCSMSDIFHENVPDKWRDRVFAVMALAQQLASSLQLNSSPNYCLQAICNLIRVRANLICNLIRA